MTPLPFVRARSIGAALSNLALGCLAASILLGASSVAWSQVGIPSYGTPVTQDFNTLTNTPDNGTSSTLPAGWVLSESGTNANTTYRVATGSLNTGDTYSFGPTANSDRAFGGILSGSLVPTIGASFKNNTGGTIGLLKVSYEGEQWRLGTLARVDRLDFQYSLDATDLTTGTWTDVDALDFTAPVTAGTVGPLDGNGAANRTAISGAISGLSLAPGAVIWIRWNDFNATNADDGLGVDDFSIKAFAAPIPAVSPWGLMILAMALAGVAAWWGIARQRALA